MKNKTKAFNSFGELLLSGRLHKIKHLFGLLLCITGINLTIIAAPADLDPTFGTNGAVFTSPDGTLNNYARAMAYDSSGKILMVGSKNPAGVGFVVARFNANGNPDTTFGGNGAVSKTFGGSSEEARGVVYLGNGKILVAGHAFFSSSNSSDLTVMRLNADGSTDTTFGTNGITIINFSDPVGASYPDFFGAIKVSSIGHIVVGGSVPNNPGSPNQRTTLARLNENGSFDESFGTGGKVVDSGYGWNDLVVRSDESIVAVGFISNSNSDVMLARKYTAAGISEWEYTRGQSGVFAQLRGIAIQGGKFVVVGEYGSNISMFRLNADGTLDASFPVDSIARSGRNTSVAVQPADNKVVISAALNDTSGFAAYNVIRLNSNGSPDTGFGSGGVVTTPYPLVQILPFKVIIQTDGKILVGGNATRSSPSGYQFTMARYLGDSFVAPAQRAMFDYDGDGKSDVSIFRPSENGWYILKSSNSGVTQQTFGASGDVPAPADFDGDGKTDVAIFRPSTGDWWYISSINSTFLAAHWGQNGDIPRPGDYDLDGKADFIVYRPSNGTWYRLGSRGESSVVQFGIAEDKPLVGDFDGDGRVDAAVYRPSTGVWWFQGNNFPNSYQSVQFGISTDIPVPADYDGDGKTDIAVYRPSTGVWHILKSVNQGYVATQFGDANDKPVAADYDGDGKVDIGVFRPSNGSWYLLRSTSGFSGVQWGASTDIPTEYSFSQ